ncbi:hypothetical protein FA13DRAFT_1802430 [Coprinellus micaceus]|uniref:CxC2-like cysteine cluster KDZ transposase-associated domain-containing protein n=1 Tax=Coprinellus micaceus TaxID=71717 RepID=A0A4Y7SCN0_COPMI|nr:hypothetical protein FA13DRAFT_1802430 [Coprinellus micaceus]
MPPPNRGRKRDYQVICDDDDDNDGDDDKNNHDPTAAFTLYSSSLSVDGDDHAEASASSLQDKRMMGLPKTATDGISSAGTATVGFDEDAFYDDDLPVKPSKLLSSEDTASTVKLPPAPSLAPYEVPSGETNIDDVDEDDAGPEPNDTRRASNPSPAVLQKEWLDHYRHDYLRELIWLEGRGGRESQKYCAGCGTEGRLIFRCKSCVGSEPLCQGCIVAVHHHNPLHFVERWNGSHYEDTTLKALGLAIYLGHAPGRRCEMLSFESKGSHEEFYKAISRLTGNVKAKGSRDRYHEFIKMVSQWRHLKMLKRAGRGHDRGGIEKTQEGACAIRCPACPQPGMNLPDGWDVAPPGKRWLYRLFIAIDGNFRLKRRLVSSDERDPGYNVGWAYFVEDVGFRRYLVAEWDSKQERSTCVAHDAVDKPDREARGLAASGVVAIVCTRHEMKLPNGVGDLQKGERYSNVDYIAFCSIRWFKIRDLVISYDIACQWHKKLMARLGRLPPSIQPKTLAGLTVLIPKFHLPAHIEYCNRTYSFNLTKGVGRTDGEAPERGWARMNAAAKSTAEMGPGTRRDTLDDLFADENWKKTQRLMASQLTKMIRAVSGSEKHEKALTEFRESIPEKFIELWLNQAEEWEANPSTAHNPFEAETTGVSEQAIRLKLAREAEEADSSHGKADESDAGVMHASLFISHGLQLEEDQHKLHIAVSALGNHPTKKQLTAMAERSNTLRRRITVWIEVQKLHMPEAEAARREKDNMSTAVGGKPSSEAYEIPSSYLPPSCLQPANLIWHATKPSSGKRKDAYSRGVAQNTRSNTAINRAQSSVNNAAKKYDRAYAALLALCGKETPSQDPEGWRKDLRVLRLKDIRGLSEGLYGETEGTREISWIWKSRSAPITSESGENIENIESDEQLQDAVRIEFLKSRARAMRWREEVELLQEEMRRILAFFKFKAEWWFSRQTSTIGGGGLDYEEGFSAYALSQCSVYHTLYRECQEEWSKGQQRGWRKPPKGKKGLNGDKDEGPCDASAAEGDLKDVQAGGASSSEVNIKTPGEVNAQDDGEDNDMDLYDDYD